MEGGGRSITVPAGGAPHHLQMCGAGKTQDELTSLLSGRVEDQEPLLAGGHFVFLSNVHLLQTRCRLRNPRSKPVLLLRSDRWNVFIFPARSPSYHTDFM